MGYSSCSHGYCNGGYSYFQARPTYQQALYHPNTQASYPGSIDRLVEELQPAPLQEMTYRPITQQYQTGAEYQGIVGRAYDSAGMFLSTVRPLTQFINQAWQIRDYITEAFDKLTGKAFPDDIIVKVCSKEELRSIHNRCGSHWKDGILGFAVNNRPGTSEVFVLQDRLDRLMLVIGHELGHVLSQRLEDAHDEEAKAFAFEFAWAETIKMHDIAGLSGSISSDITPAANGLHDVSWNFVRKLLREGMDAIDIYSGLIRKALSIQGLTLNRCRTSRH